MRKWTLLLLLWMAWPALAAKTRTLTVAQMDLLLSTLHGQRDGKVAGVLDHVYVTERVSQARLARWEAEFPGKHTQEALREVADAATFLDPPAYELVVSPRPPIDVQEHILSLVVESVKNTMARLPDFLATRETMHFAGISAPPDASGKSEEPELHLIGRYRRTVTYRNGLEVPFRDEGKKINRSILGLTSDGEFGPILLQVFRDALQSDVRFLRWGKGVTGRAVVFGYTVPEKASHFHIETTEKNVPVIEHPPYHGEIEVDSATGHMLRLSEIADFGTQEKIKRAAIEVEYAPVTIGGRVYICPVRAVAFLRMAIPNWTPLYSSTNPSNEKEWSIQTHLNDVTFKDYQKFRTVVRIFPDDIVSQ